MIVRSGDSGAEKIMSSLFILLVLAVATAPTNPWHEQIVKLGSAERNAIFARIVKPDPCGSVMRTFFQGQASDGTANWSVGCSNGRSYAVSLFNDSQGSTKVLDCRLLKAVAQIDCFKKLE